MSSVYDYIIVGAGISGLSSAYHLSKDGYRVLVLEENDGKESASFASTAEMNHDPDADWDLIIAHFGIEGAQALWKLFGDTFDTLSEFAHQIGESHFKTERVPAYLYTYTNGADTTVLKKKYALYEKIGAHVTLHTPSQPDLHPSFASVLTIHGDGVTNNQHLISSLRHGIIEQGGQILNHQKVVSIQDSVVPTMDGTIYKGDTIIVATGDGKGLLPIATEIERKITFVVSLQREGIPDLFRNAVMWDTDEPYHYTRSFAGNRIWIGGEDVYEKEYYANSVIDEDKYQALIQYASDVLGIDRSYTRQASWKGTFYPSKRGLPYVGEVEGTRMLASVGFGGSGLMTSFLSGYLIAAWERGELLEYKQYFALHWS